MKAGLTAPLPPADAAATAPIEKQGGRRVRRVLTLWTAAILAVVVAGCSRPTPSLEEAYQTASEAPDVPAVQFAAWRRLLRHHPDTPHTIEAADAVIRIASRELEQPHQAREVLEEVLDQVENPRTRRTLQRRLAHVLGDLRDEDGLRQLVGEMAAESEPGFGEALTLLDAAVTGEAWPLTLELADRAMVLATPEAYRRQAPGSRLGDDEVERIAGRRTAMVLASRGRAQARLGDLDAALATFEQAAAGSPLSYMGQLPPPLSRYWGLTLLEAGRPQEALDHLAGASVMGGDEDAGPVLRRAWDAAGFPEEEFERFLWDTRLALSRPLEDFELPDMDGRPFRMAEQGRDQVVLLAFWFPT